MRNEVHYSNACNIVCWKAFVSHLYTYIEFFCFQTYALLSWCVWFLILLTVQWWHLVTKSWAYELWNTLHVGILSELFPDWDLCVCRTPATMESGQKRCVGRCWDFIFLALGAGSGLLASNIGCRIRRRALMNLTKRNKGMKGCELTLLKNYNCVLWIQSVTF